MNLYEAPGDRYQIRKYDGMGFPYGIWDTKTKKFVARGQKEDKSKGIIGNLEKELERRNKQDRENREKENKSMNLYGGIRSNFREANSMKVSKDITKNKDFSNSLKKLGYDKIIGKANAKDNKTLVANNKGDSLVIDKNKGRLNKFKAAGKKANFKKDEEKELMRYKTESAMRKHRFKESAVVNKEADYGSIADIDGIQCYIAGSTQQGYCFKDMSVYENDPNGVCYICEGAFDDYCAEYDPDRKLRDAAIPVEYIEKNKAKLIKWGSISTRNSIMDEVRAMLGYSWYYDTADGKHIDGKDFDDEFVARIADDVIDIVDWQSTSAYINADLDNEDVIGESIEEYYDKKFNTMKESEAFNPGFTPKMSEENKKKTLTLLNAIKNNKRGFEGDFEEVEWHLGHYMNKEDADKLGKYIHSLGDKLSAEKGDNYLITAYDILPDVISWVKGIPTSKQVKESDNNNNNLATLNEILGEWDFVSMTGDVTEPYISYVKINGDKINVTIELWDPVLDDYVSIDGGEYAAPEIVDMINKADFSDDRYSVADNIATNMYLMLDDNYRKLRDQLYDQLHKQRREEGYEDENGNRINESQTQEIDTVLKALKEKNPNIEKYLNEYYKSIADTEPRPAYDKEKDRMDPAWENWNKTTNNVLYSREAWENFTNWVKEKYGEDLKESAKRVNESEEDEEKTYPGLFGEVLKLIEDKGWNCMVNEEDCEIGIENWSPAGEDMYDYLSYGSNDLSDDEKGKNLIESLGQLAENFDADEHAEMYIDMRGQNGVPNDIRTLIEDADDIQKMYDDLYDSALALERNRT